MRHFKWLREHAFWCQFIRITSIVKIPDSVHLGGWAIRGEGAFSFIVALHRTYIYCSRSRNIKIFINSSQYIKLRLFLSFFFSLSVRIKDKIIPFFNTQPRKRNKMLRKEKIKPDDNMQCNSAHNAQSMLVSKSPVSQLSPKRNISRYPREKHRFSPITLQTIPF